MIAPLLAAAIGAASCAKAYGEDEALVEAGAPPAADGPAPARFCAGSRAPVCDDFSSSISNAWQRRLASNSTLEIDVSNAFSAPGALRARVVSGTGAAPPLFALLEQQVALPDTTRDLYVDARVQTIDTDAVGGGVRVLRLDSRGLPAIVVVQGDSAILATQANMGLRQIGKTFPWTAKRWHFVSVHFLRVAGIGATVEVSLDDRGVVAEGQLETFDPPFTLQVGAYRETAPSTADVLYDDVTLHE